jgi:hypothetical protein
MDRTSRAAEALHFCRLFLALVHPWPRLNGADSVVRVGHPL